MQPDNDGRLLKEEIDLLGPRAPSRRFPQDIKERVVAWVHAKRAAGVPRQELIAFLGIPWETIIKWMGRSAAPPTGGTSTPAPKAAALRPVKVVGSGEPCSTKAGGITLRTPRGFVVEGLDMASLEHLLSRLG